MRISLYRLSLLAILLNLPQISADAILSESTQKSALPGDRLPMQHVYADEDDDGDLLGDRRQAEESKKRKSTQIDNARKKSKLNGLDQLLLAGIEDENDDNNNAQVVAPISHNNLQNQLAVVPPPPTIRPHIAGKLNSKNKTKVQYNMEICSLKVEDLTNDEINALIHELEELINSSDYAYNIERRKALLPLYENRLDLVLGLETNNAENFFENSAEAKRILSKIAQQAYKWPILIKACKKIIQIIAIEFSELPEVQYLGRLKPIAINTVIELQRLVGSKTSSGSQKCDAKILIANFLHYAQLDRIRAPYLKRTLPSKLEYLNEVLNDPAATDDQKQDCRMYIELYS
jgi:hypothetical protein